MLSIPLDFTGINSNSGGHNRASQNKAEETLAAKSPARCKNAYSALDSAVSGFDSEADLLDRTDFKSKILL